MFYADVFLAQWGGVSLVFLGLSLEVYHKYLDKKERQAAAATKSR